MARPLNNNSPLNGWPTRIRQAVVLTLGVVVILNATFSHAADVIEWTAGLVLIGIIPVEAVFAWWHTNRQPTLPPSPPTSSPTEPPPSDPSP